MKLPPDLVAAVEDAPAIPGRVRGARALGGGCIHHACRLDTDGGPLFCKWNRGEAGAAFGAEARGLEALAAAAGEAGLRIPRVEGWGDAEGGRPGWLLLEWVPPSPPAPDYPERLGRGLAFLHRPVGASWGWDEDNRIGSLPQENAPRATWGAFWRERRLLPQLRRAVEGGLLTGDGRRLVEGAADRAPDLLATVEDDGPSVVHGDLWAGNVHPGPDGRPVLVDPAVYRGHREVDLAMAALFGGLPPRSRDAYREASPLRAGAAERRPVYQLYYLLVHLNLFGAGYLEACRGAARRILGSG